jgi:uncharacterized protein (TIGR00730 family)
MANDIRSLCVYCGSSDGYVASHAAAAHDLGIYLANNRINLVYGGTAVGLMGIIANTVLKSGGTVTGVTTEHFHAAGITHAGVTQSVITPDMHSRKAEMMLHADAFVALPGGIGTLEEVAEALSWAHIGHHRKPVGLLNVDGFYNPLIQMLDQMVASGFYRQEQRDTLVIAVTPEELIDKLQTATWPDVTKWVK